MSWEYLGYKLYAVHASVHVCVMYLKSSEGHILLSSFCSDHREVAMTIMSPRKTAQIESITLSKETERTIYF